MDERNFILRDCIGWGFALWLVGYLLGFLFYALVPPEAIGWYVMPIGTAMTLFVLWKWVRVDAVGHALLLGAVWSALAVVLDYVFILKLLNPPDGYYKLDVYLYYFLAFVLPPAVAGLRR
ncbi:MAG: hypothetical protein GY723_23535 [bacterium]|nr:hypothetical protein [bacterium]MCP5065026.1 hypothetical protein [bacterium]